MEDSGIDSEDRQSNIYEDGAAGLLVSIFDKRQQQLREGNAIFHW